MLRGKENGGIPRRIHIWVYLFIIREWGYTSPPQEIHFLYNEKFNFLFLNFVCKPTRLFSLPLCVIKSIAFSSIFSHVGLLFLCLTFIKCVLMSLKSLSVQIIPDFPLQPSRSFFFLCHFPCLSMLRSEIPQGWQLDEDFHHLSVRELRLVQQAADPASVVRRLPMARRVLCQIEGRHQLPIPQEGHRLSRLSKMDPRPIPLHTQDSHHSACEMIQPTAGTHRMTGPGFRHKYKPGW